jgi:hypothetical protein
MCGTCGCLQAVAHWPLVDILVQCSWPSTSSSSHRSEKPTGLLSAPPKMSSLPSERETLPWPPLPSGASVPGSLCSKPADHKFSVWGAGQCPVSQVKCPHAVPPWGHSRNPCP